jgi:hypothetical protein
MASDYPASIDAFPDPLVNSPLNSPSHAALHQDVNDAVEKIEVKLGVNASPASGASADEVLMADGSGGSDWSNIGAGNIKTEGAPSNAVLVSDGAGSGSWSNAVGLWKVSTFSFTGATSAAPVNAIGVFTDFYQNYRIVLNVTSGTANASISLQLLSGSTPATGANYRFASIGAFNNTTASNNGSLVSTSLELTNATQNGYLSVMADVYQPLAVRKTNFFGDWLD